LNLPISTGPTVKFAPTVVAARRITVHGFVEPHDGLHPLNTLPVAGVAESTTVMPAGKLAVHVLGQSMPAGDDDTRPVPVPPRVAVRG
jgi:hypothetical protein